MKRRSPSILAAISLLGVSTLAYHASQQEQERALAPAPPISPSSGSKSKPPEQDLITEPAATKLAPLTDAPPLGKRNFHLMADGSPVPALAEAAPKRVKLGVVLFRYKGAQGTTDSTRSKKQAQVLAEKAHALAKTDFAAAVKQGDRGSLGNIGWFDQRILERSVEYAVFSLEKGQISDGPIDTPRGLWVVKRIR